jgi:hypothetical protein
MHVQEIWNEVLKPFADSSGKQGCNIQMRDN